MHTTRTWILRRGCAAVLPWIALLAYPVCAATPGADPPSGATATPAKQKLGAPRIEASAIAPTMIRLVAHAAAGEPTYQVVIERKPETGRDDFFTLTAGNDAAGWQATGVQDAVPDTLYRYRAYAEPTPDGSAHDLDRSEWSDEILVRTPPPPSERPGPPSDLAARAVSPFAVELRWRDGAGVEYGFEVQEADDRGRWVRAALVDPDRTTFVHHGRVPGRELRYRVRAFNPNGVSDPTDEVAVRTPLARDDSTRDPARERTPCTSRDEALRAVAERHDRDEEPTDSMVERIDLGAGRSADLITDRASCAGGGCGLDLYAEYDGCYRKIGGFFGLGLVRFADGPGGWPIVETDSRCSSDDWSTYRHQMVGGEYFEVDRSVGPCSAGDDLTKETPPFRAPCSDGVPCQDR